MEVIVAPVEAVEGAAQIDQRAFLPVMFVDDLQFKVDDAVVVEQRVYVQEEGLGVNGSAQNDGVGDADGTDFVGRHMEKGVDEPFECVIAALEQRPEQVVIVHADGYGAGGGAKVGVCCSGIG